MCALQKYDFLSILLFSGTNIRMLRDKFTREAKLVKIVSLVSGVGEIKIDLT